MLERFGKDAHPPPWQTFTIGNVYDRGNLHMVQKVYEGAFEVSYGGFKLKIETDMVPSLMCYTHPSQRLSL